MQLDDTSSALYAVALDLLAMAELVRDNAFARALRLYAGYVAIFGLKVFGREGRRHLEYIAALRENPQFSSEFRLFERLLYVRKPYWLSRFLRAKDYGRRAADNVTRILWLKKI